MEKSPSEIVKLTERISKDPKSKLFVPLAEEYKKIGDIEMAIYVLSEGLKQNPTYVTARSLLGRLLLENGDLVAAQKEFEEVVKVVPDNLMGRRKLGDLYLRQNKKTEALQQYKVALSLNPGDKPFAQQVAELEEQLRVSTTPELKIETKPQIAVPAAAQEQQKALEQSVSLPASPAPKGPEPQAIAAPESQPLKQEPRIEPAEGIAPSMPEKKAETTQTAKVAVDESAITTAPAEIPTKEIKAPEAGIFPESKQDLTAAPFFETEEPEEVLAFEPLEEEPSAVQEVVSAPESFEGFMEEKAPSVGNVFDTTSSVLETVDLQAEPLGVLKREEPASDSDIVSADEMDLFGEASQKPAVVFQEEPHQVSGEGREKQVGAAAESALLDEWKESEPEQKKERPEEQSDDFTTDTLAELYIAQGFYEKAIDIYQRMVENHPESVGLQNKLARVKAMAAGPEETVALSNRAPEPLDEPVAAPARVEAKEYVAPIEETAGALEDLLAIPEAVEQQKIATGLGAEKAGPVIPPLKEEEEITIDAEILVEPEEGLPDAGIPGEKQEPAASAATGELSPSSAEEPSLDVFTVQEDESLGEVKPAYRGFEPQEYVPPDASVRSAKKAATPAESGPPRAGKKETVDRLEKWLTTIMKEK